LLVNINSISCCRLQLLLLLLLLLFVASTQQGLDQLHVTMVAPGSIWKPQARESQPSEQKCYQLLLLSQAAWTLPCCILLRDTGQQRPHNVGDHAAIGAICMRL
jgi:hypothetical protein